MKNNIAQHVAVLLDMQKTAAPEQLEALKAAAQLMSALELMPFVKAQEAKPLTWEEIEELKTDDIIWDDESRPYIVEEAYDFEHNGEVVNLISSLFSDRISRAEIESGEHVFYSAKPAAPCNVL